MRIHRSSRVALATIISVVACGAAQAASHDYYVHGAAYAPGPNNYQPSWITMDALNGTPLTPPDDACGMRFEGDWTPSWYGNPYGSTQHYAADDGISDVWLPSPDCSAWTGVTIEPKGDSLHVVPYEFDGYIEVDARGYWIDTFGEKLIYKHQPCHPMPSCILAPGGFVANGWSKSLRTPIRELRLAQVALGGTGTVAIARVQQAIAIAARETTQNIGFRRGVDTGSLERPMRQLEDAAVASLDQAQRDASTCGTALNRGDRAGAYRACGDALRRVEAARAALDAGDAWIE